MLKPLLLDDTRFTRRPFTFGASPVHPMPRLSAHLGGAVELWAKRDDSNSGLAYGGNKTRKLEYLVPDAIAAGADTLVSIGGIQSNHTRQVAAVAANVGLRCVLVHDDWVPTQHPLYGQVGNILISKMMGADLRYSTESFTIGTQEGWEGALESVEAAGHTPYAIPTGASEHPLGGLGYVRFVDELLEQEEKLGFAFDKIVLASGSGSTQAGILVGLERVGRQRDVIGIDITARPAETRAAVLSSARRTVDTLGLSQNIANDDVVLSVDYAGPRYGVPSEGTLEGIDLFARYEGILGDPAYEGKSMHGLVDMVRTDRFAPGDRVLYVHLGGTPAIHAHSDELFV